MGSDLKNLQPLKVLEFLTFLEKSDNFTCEKHRISGTILKIGKLTVSMGLVDELTSRRMGVDGRLFALEIPAELSFLADIKMTVIASRDFIGIRFFVVNEFMTILFPVPAEDMTEILEANCENDSVVPVLSFEESINSNYKEKVFPLLTEEKGNQLLRILMSGDRDIRAAL